MYRKKNHEQAEFEPFHLSFGGRLRSDNRWVKLSKIVPWEQIERRYTVRLTEDRGAPALSACIALGSLIIKEKLGLSDEKTVEQTRENPYLQYFLGYEAYRDEQPFDPSMMVHFRKRLGGEIVNEINELVTSPHVDSEDHHCVDDEESSRSAESDSQGDRQTATLHGRLGLFGRRKYRALLVAQEVYRQHKQMYDQRGHSAPDRIVSQPHVRPIGRGKASAPVEFGAKISVSRVGRFAFLDRLSSDSYNETTDLKPVVEHYRERYGCYPESVHVDAIYRTRENRRY